MQKITTEQVVEEGKHAASTSPPMHSAPVPAAAIAAQTQEQNGENVEETEGKRPNGWLTGIGALIYCFFMVGGILWSIHTIPRWFGNTGPFLSQNIAAAQFLVLQITWIVIIVLSIVSTAALVGGIERCLVEFTERNKKA